MSPDVFQLTALQCYKEKKFSDLRNLVLEALETNRVVTRQALGELLAEAEDAFRRQLFDFMLADGGKDLIPQLLKVLAREPNQGVLEQKLSALGNFKHPEMIEALESYEQYLPPNMDRILLRVKSKLAARFVEYQNMRAFRNVTDRELSDLAAAMARVPDPSYVPFLNQYLDGRDLERAAAAVRVLRTAGGESSFDGMLKLVGVLLRHRRTTHAFAQLPFMKEGGPRPTGHEVYNAIMGCPALEWTIQERGRMKVSFDEASDSLIHDLVTPFGFTGEVLAQTTGYVRYLLTVPTGLADNSSVRKVLQQRMRRITDALTETFLSLGKIARRTKNTRFPQRLQHFLPPGEPHRELTIAWGLAGYGDDEARDQILGFLDKCSDRLLQLAYLDVLKRFTFSETPYQIIDFARQDHDGDLRRSALETMAISKDAPTHFEKLLSSSPMVVRADICRTVGAKQLKNSYPTLLGFLRKQITDSFRTVLIEGLAAFDSNETALSVQLYVRPPHVLSVRKAALTTLLRAGGENKMDLAFQGIMEPRDRHRQDMVLHFCKAAAKYWPLPVQEGAVLARRDFLEGMLQSPEPEVRQAVLALLERCEWIDPMREGWSDVLQRALSSPGGARGEEEIERIRALIERLSSRFESERKVQKMRRQFEEVMRGMETPSNAARHQALRKLDWIYRPEMLTGNPEAVRRLVNEIERFMDNNAEDTDLEILAIEVAGKIGHPFLRRKIREYVDHEHPGVARAARIAMEKPMNQQLVDNLIQTVFSMDDSSYMTRMVTMLLKDEGYAAVGENDCFKGLDRLRDQSFDLLILDLNMPQMRGLDFLIEARKRGVCPRFVFILTSVRTQDDLIEVFKEGVDGIILKPFRSQDLVEKILELKERCA